MAFLILGKTLGKKPLWCEAHQGFFLGSVCGNSLVFASENIFNILPRESKGTPLYGVHWMYSIFHDTSLTFPHIVPVSWDFRHTAEYSYFFVIAETLNINTRQLLNIQRWIIGTLSIQTRHSQHPHSALSASLSALSAFTLGTCWVYSQQSQQMRWAETFSSVCCNSINP